MAVKGIARYQRLFKNVVNWQEYILHKGERKNRSLKFTTRPIPVTFEVPETLYQIFKEIFMEDFYDVEKLLSQLPEEPVIVDVGANAGFFSTLLFSKIKKAQVFAYEPMPINVLLFEATIRNNPAMQSIQLHQLAVTGLPKKHLELFTADTVDNTVVSSVFADFDGLNKKKILVPATSLASIIEQNNLDKVDILKLDCEGSEYDIIYNTEPSILKKVRMMVIEVHQIDTEKNNLAELSEYLQNCGYKIRHRKFTSATFYLEAVKLKT